MFVLQQQIPRDFRCLKIALAAMLARQPLPVTSVGTVSKEMRVLVL
jgi:hypothetical protein